MESSFITVDVHLLYHKETDAVGSLGDRCVIASFSEALRLFTYDLHHILAGEEILSASFSGQAGCWQIPSICICLRRFLFFLHFWSTILLVIESWDHSLFFWTSLVFHSLPSFLCGCWCKVYCVSHLCFLVITSIFPLSFLSRFSLSLLFYFQW